MGILVYREGNIIDLGSNQLQVAEACSGLRYLLPLITFGVLCAYMYRAPFWAKALVVLLTIPISVALNGARIAMTGRIVEFGAPELADGFMHLFEGWVVFLIALGTLFGAMWMLLRLQGWRGRMIDMLDFDRMAGMPGGCRPRRGSPMPDAVAFHVVPRPLIGSAALLAVTAILLVPIELRPQTLPARPGLITYPLVVNDWTGVPSLLDRRTVEVLGSDDYLLTDYSTPGETGIVNLWVAYYGSQRDGSGVHLPTTCLPSAGWEFVEFGSRRLPLTNLQGEPLVVNRGVIVKGHEQIVMYFWMEMRGRSLVNGSTAKVVNFWDSLTTGRSDGALVRVFTPLASGEDPPQGEDRLLRFLERGYPLLEPHVGA